jgi:hypothetical protein
MFREHPCRCEGAIDHVEGELVRPGAGRGAVRPDVLHVPIGDTAAADERLDVLAVAVELAICRRGGAEERRSVGGEEEVRR